MLLLNLYEEDEEIVEYLNLSPEEVFEDKEKNIATISNYLLKLYNNSSDRLCLPSFNKSMKWINTHRPILLEDLLDKIIIIDFFTYCCINCEHILPYLNEVEKEFKGDSTVVMIGIHSPKFPNEKNFQNVKDAVIKNNIKHPVLQDENNFFWNQFGVYCWPTVLLLGPDHTVLFSLVGEDQVRHLKPLLHQTLEFFKIRNIKLNARPLPIEPLSSNMSQVLNYPTYITKCGDCIIISDTGHNRLILLSFDGVIMDIIGNGDAGLSDGSYSQASFNNPHGTAWIKPNKVFVADTGNHSIREINLKSRQVSTIFTNKQSKSESTDLESKEKAFKFSSPWDVCMGPKFSSDLKEADVLYIAVAGSHQIWALYLSDSIISDQKFNAGSCVPFAGNGKEECRNNCYRMKAGFAQPSGIMYSDLNPGTLYIADSESSSIRSISLTNGAVKTVVGGGFNPEDLFQFGDIDGKALNAKLQHPLALCAYKEEKILIADTYNHKIKLVDTKTRECLTLFNGKCDSELQSFHEPSGLCYLAENHMLFVSDTNHHVLKCIDLETKTVKQISVQYSENNVDGPVSKSINQIESENNISTVKLRPFSKQVDLVDVNLNLDGEIHCCADFNTDGADVSVKPWSVSFKGDCDWKMVCPSGSFYNQHNQPSLILNCIKASEGNQSEIELDIQVSMCDNEKKTCFAASGKIKLLVKAVKDGCKVFTLKITL